MRSSNLWGILFSKKVIRQIQKKSEEGEILPKTTQNDEREKFFNSIDKPQMSFFMFAHFSFEPFAIIIKLATLKEHEETKFDQFCLTDKLNKKSIKRKLSSVINAEGKVVKCLQNDELLNGEISGQSFLHLFVLFYIA